MSEELIIWDNIFQIRTFRSEWKHVFRSTLGSPFIAVTLFKIRINGWQFNCHRMRHFCVGTPPYNFNFWSNFLEYHKRTALQSLIKSSLLLLWEIMLTIHKVWAQNNGQHIRAYLMRAATEYIVACTHLCARLLFSVYNLQSLIHERTAAKSTSAISLRARFYSFACYSRLFKINFICTTLKREMNFKLSTLYLSV